MNFGEKLRTLRAVHEKTQKDVAEHLGITIASYSYYENNLRRPDYAILGKLASYFNSSYQYLLDEDEYGDIDPLFDSVFKRYTNMIVRAKKLMLLIDKINSNNDSVSKYKYYMNALNEIYINFESVKDAVKHFIDIDKLEDVFEEYLEDLGNL